MGKQLFIEICRAKPAWLALSEAERTEFLRPVDSLMRRLEAEGTEILAWGFNYKTTPARAPYDFFAVLQFQDIEDAERYEKTFKRAGWYDYFEQVNILGAVELYSETLARLIKL